MAHSRLTIEESPAKSVLVAQDGPPVTSYTLNPYGGCGMGCSYCYVMKYPYAVEHPQPWGTWVRPKTNAPFLLGKVRAKIWGRNIFVGSATDPYQYVERKYRLTRRCLMVLLESNPASVVVHTRSHLILEDLELLQAFGDRLCVGFSVPTDDDRVLRSAGVKVTASLSPLLYCSPRRFVKLIKESADGAYMGSMRYLDKTGLQSMERASAYFRSGRYRELVEEMDRRLVEAGLKKEHAPAE